MENASTNLNIDLSEVRAALPILEETAYFNTGTIGVMARPVLDVYLDSIERFQSRGWVMWQDMTEATERGRARLAAQIGAIPAEITLTRNATDGANLVAAGIEWRDGDEVIISDQEHPALLFPWTYQAQLGRIQLRTFRVEFDPSETLANLRGQINERTRVVAVNHITSPFGIRLPVKEICDVARDAGALSLVDGAQSFGKIKIAMDEMGCDFYTGNCHKWLGGPNGTGFLCSRAPAVEQLRPCHVGAGSGKIVDGESLDFHPDGRRFEYATKSEASYATVSAAIDWFDEIGWERVEARTEMLVGYLKDRLSETKGVRLLTPVEWEWSSGLTSFTAGDFDHSGLLAALKSDWNVWPRTLEGERAIRVSTAYFNTTEEIDRLIAGVESYAALK